MFFDFGAGELAGLAVLAMILIGPERLPNFAVDAARFVKKVREMATNATNELKDNLGPGFEDLKPTDLNPKTFIQKQLSSVLDESDKPASKAKFVSKIDPDLL
jgi:sec-independent protein translocase protein TatB